MTPNEYQDAALRTASDHMYPTPHENMLLEGVLGLCGESGEAADLVKKVIFQGHPLDKTKIAEELGDAAWYLAVTAHAIGYEFDTILQMNINKLRNRYPDGFDPQRSINRQEFEGGTT